MHHRNGVGIGRPVLETGAIVGFWPIWTGAPCRILDITGPLGPETPEVALVQYRTLTLHLVVAA